MLGVLRLYLSMPILLEGASQVFRLIDPVCTRGFKAGFRPCVISHSSDPGEFMPPTKTCRGHVEGSFKQVSATSRCMGLMHYKYTCNFHQI